MSIFIAYVLIPPDKTAVGVIALITSRLDWGFYPDGLSEYDVPPLRILTVTQALEERPEPLSLHKQVYSTLVDANGIVYKGYDFTPAQQVPDTTDYARHVIQRFDADGWWRLYADDAREPEAKDRRSPTWQDFVQLRLRNHVGTVGIVHGSD